MWLEYGENAGMMNIELAGARYKKMGADLERYGFLEGAFLGGYGG
jgi:hypothetical protein